MEQLAIDSYMLLCKQNNSISINQQILSFYFDSNLNKKILASIALLFDYLLKNSLHHCFYEVR